MSLEILNQLEARIQHTVNTIKTLQDEIDIYKQKNNDLEQLINDEAEEMKKLQAENEKLKQEQNLWQERISTLLNKIGEISQ
ncbi:cell division protein ZapB [Frischella sp. Ac48]|uniref:Cell division protein ZapB n=1 Tax=Frischella japonica TaxID=2741544 RepID=A0ABR7QVU3_9GAMM|nr:MULTISPECIES: cell division protein ZapB [Frischella]MBC9130316.1 cell division protein ZapB [Frischella japonica]MBX4133305.1 cell division protein ZapB [Frischella sp. Ac48]